MGKRPRKDGELSDDAVDDDEGMMDEGSEEAEEEERPITLQPAAPAVEGSEVVKSASPAPRAKGPSTPSKSSQSANKLVVAKPLPAFKATDVPEFVVPWQSLSKADKRTAMDMLTEAYRPLRESILSQRSRTRVARIKVSRKRKQGVEVTEEDEAAAHVRGGGDYKDEGAILAMRKSVCLGLNEVTRGLEKKQLSLVLVCNDARPQLLTQHLPLQSQACGVPLCAIGERSERLGGVFGAPSALAVGFKSAVEGEAGWEGNVSCVQFIKARLPRLVFPWLHEARRH